MTSNPTKRKVAIIGAGASGLVAIKCCLDEDISPVCFEKTSAIGGLWNYKNGLHEDRGVVMKTTVINTSKEMMCYSDYPIPDEFPNYMHNTKVYEYFELYANEFDLYKYIKFNHRVDNVSKVENTNGKWKVCFTDLDSDQSHKDEFDAVFLCNGHHADKRVPQFPGQELFKGRTVHTHDYKDHQGYEDKNVVIIGIGNSGGDVAVELSRIGKHVYLSTRRGSWVINRIIDNGMPTDMILTRRVTEFFKWLTGSKIANWLGEAQLNKRFDHKMYGLKPEHSLLSQHPMVNDELPNRIACGSVIVKPNVERFTESGVVFDDGTSVEADVVVFATGYVFGFPFLQKGIIDVDDNKVDLYKYVFPPDLSPPTLAVIGCVQPWGAINPISELQCRWACRVFKGTTQLPSRDEMWQDIKAKRNAMQARYVTSPRHTIQVDWIPFMDDVAKEFGSKPNMGKLFLEDFRLACRVYFGPCTPYQYRLHGPGQWAGARDAIMTQWDRVYAPFKTRKVAASASAGGGFILLLVLLLSLVAAYLLYF